MITTVDGELFDTLEEAIAFVCERGGGIVYTPLAGTLFAESLKLPEGVKLQPQRQLDAEPRAA
jgi:hypothetical protein